MPKVSIIINCHNGEKYLQEAIESVYAQTFRDWEIIFYDNASVDGSAEIAKRCDEKLRYFRGETLIPLGAARKTAVLLATGEWVAFLDCDDRWCPEKLSIQLAALEGTDFVLCYAGIREITAGGRKIRDVLPLHHSGNLVEALLRQFDINMVTPMFKRELVSQFGLNFDDNITASEEYNLFVRLATKGPVLVQNLLLGDYRIYPGSLTQRQISRWAFERRYTLGQLKQENPGLEQRYPNAFREAEARANYYEARYFMSEGRATEARKVMMGIASVDFRYHILYRMLYVPFLWNLAHSIRIRQFLKNLTKRFIYRFDRS